VTADALSFATSQMTLGRDSCEQPGRTLAASTTSGGVSSRESNVITLIFSRWRVAPLYTRFASCAQRTVWFGSRMRGAGFVQPGCTFLTCHRSRRFTVASSTDLTS